MSIGIGFAAYLLLQLLLALLVVKGVLPEGSVFGAQTAAGMIGTFLGGLWAVGSLPWGALPAAISAALGIAAITVLTGFAVYDGILLSVGTLLRIAAMLAGGFAAALAVGGRGGKRQRKRKSIRSARGK